MKIEIKKIIKIQQHLFCGRVDRLQFLFSSLLVFILPIFVILFYLAIDSYLRTSFWIGLVVANLIGVSFFGSLFLVGAIYMRRLHDIGLSGWIALFPVINIIFILIALVWPGGKSVNKYGDVPHSNKSIQGVIFNRGKSSQDKSEPWSTLVFFVLIMLLFLGFIFLQIRSIKKLESLNISNFYNVNYFRAYGRNFSVSAGDLKVICVEDITLTNISTDINNLDKLMPTIVKTCRENFNAQLYYGNGEVYDMHSRSNPDFTQDKKYLFVLLQNLGNRGGQTSERFFEYQLKKGEKADTNLMVYNMSDNFNKVYAEDIGYVTPLRENEDIKFNKSNVNGEIDVQIEISPSSKNLYKTFVYKNNTLEMWLNAAKNPEYSFSIRNGIVYENGELLIGADPESFEILSYEYAKDKNRVYGGEGRSFDPNTFVVLDQEGDYVKDKNGVYFEGYNNWAGLTEETLILDSDPETFQYLGNNFSKDKNYVYNFVWKVDKTDAQTFELIKDEDGNLTNYQKDKNYVYSNTDIIENADPTTFKPLGGFYGMDANNIYGGLNIIPNVDRETFEIIKLSSERFAKDKYRVYVGDRVIEGADPSSFVILNEVYEKDKFHVYYNGNLIPDADPLTFEIIDYFTARDRNHKYVDNYIVND